MSRIVYTSRSMVLEIEGPRKTRIELHMKPVRNIDLDIPAGVYGKRMLGFIQYEDTVLMFASSAGRHDPEAFRKDLEVYRDVWLGMPQCPIKVVEYEVIRKHLEGEEEQETPSDGSPEPEGACTVYGMGLADDSFECLACKQTYPETYRKCKEISDESH